MHELSLLENVRSILEDHAKEQNFQRVEEITLAIGALSCVETEALAFAFEAVMKGSLAENAQLRFKRIEAQGRCLGCGQLTVMEMLYDACEHCDHPYVDVVTGLEMKITELKVS
jgi:hydrogenase nickel incorporation protein HypA/HybF